MEIYKLNLRGKEIRIRLNWKEHKNLYLPIQRHTSRVIELKSFPQPPMIGDAVITNLPGIEIGVKTADCLPIAILGENWIGIVHAGWRGLKSEIIEETISRISAYEDTENLFVFLGPCAKGCCYEVGPELEELFPEYVKRKGEKLFLDLQEVALDKLKQLGVKTVGFLEKCTICTPTFPSYRRDKTQDRMLTSVRIKNSAERTS